MSVNIEMVQSTEYAHSSIQNFRIMQGFLQLMAYFILKMDDLLRKVGTEVLAFGREIRENILTGLITNNQEIISRVVEMKYLIFELKHGYLALWVSEGYQCLVSNQNNYEKFSMADNLIQDHSSFSILLINDQDKLEDLQTAQYRRIKEQPLSLGDHCKESESVYPRLEWHTTQAVPVKNEKDFVLGTCDQKLHWDPYYREEVDSNLIPTITHEPRSDVSIIGEGFDRVIPTDIPATNILTAYLNHYETTERKRHSNTEQRICPDSSVHRNPGYVLRMAGYYESLYPGKQSLEYLLGRKHNTPTGRYCLREFKLIDRSRKINSTRCF